MYLLLSRSVSQYLLGVSKAYVLIDNSARMLRREEKVCQPVRPDNCATIHRHNQWDKIGLIRDKG
ncbi:hypothetical protein BSQ98_02360 [Serratia liquefaciens]|uniref:Uncharacterized protein n=1 Tax=Serratia liquefaciens TaxID=614 RepID=A0A515D1X9_SERLI|nr:hypothetical protein AL485_24995 [Serratia liquefaciens]AYO40628.1 hypothetical protein EBA31_26610 [Serratia sp. P2ACOL2]OKP21663.1 hypothetical protein BSQ35_12630 [Serratia liquefaciens]PVD40624.1 hypothetical protein C5188_19670 [Serratia liquefaciens]QDL34418.1 hypothetical protein EGO53_22695 [Serratia liquefaciens]